MVAPAAAGDTRPEVSRDLTIEPLLLASWKLGYSSTLALIKKNNSDTYHLDRFPLPAVVI